MACAVLPVSLGSPNMPTEYYVEATMTMPYYGLVEPITAYYSDSTGMGRLDYWEGIDRYIYNSSGTAFQIVPTSTDGVHSEETCFISGTGAAPITLFPDMTYFPEEADEDPDCEVRGISCVSYTLSSPTYNETTGFDGIYTLKVSKEGIPLQFHFTGFNVILGSHYDEYIFDYLVIDSLDDHVTATTFSPPTTSECVILETDDVSGDDGGPTFSGPRPEGGIVAAVEDIASMMPCPMARARKAKRFTEFAATHRSNGFASDTDMFHRASLYHATERYVNSMNRQRKSFWLGLNHMADWTKEERAHLRGRQHTAEGTSFPATFTHETTTSTTDLPDAVDWVSAGAVTPPKDQGTCGSCWSYGATGTTEGQLFLKTGTLTPLSQQNLMDCSWSEGNNACDGGLDTRGYDWMMHSNNGNLATEESYPYMNSDGFCRATTTTIGATITGYANITDGVPGLNDALHNVGPISVSVDAAADTFYFYQGGLYYDEECKSGLSDLDHTVLAVGYGSVDGQMYTLVKNSWSDHWGEGGFIRVSQQDNCCGVATQPTYVALQ